MPTESVNPLGTEQCRASKAGLDTKLFIIDSKYFNTGIEIQNNKVTRTAPIVKYMIGWESNRVQKYCTKKNWLGYFYPMQNKEEDWKWAETALQLFETKEKAKVWLHKFKEAENSLNQQEGVNPMNAKSSGFNTNTNITSEQANSLPEGVKARYLPQKEVLVYQAEEDVMPANNEPEAA